MSRKTLIAVPSPAPMIVPGDVVLYAQTWRVHIEPHHRDVLLGHVRQAMVDPCVIAESSTVPGNYVFLNTNAGNAAGEPLRVPVRPFADGTNVVTSAYYSDATVHGKVVWRRGDG